MKAIILAAGRGSRLGNYSADMPKCMLMVGPRRIIDYQMQCLEALHIRDVVVVIGFKGASLEQYLRSTYPEVRFTFIENRSFTTTNTAYSLWLARDAMKDDDFLYFNGDVVFHAEILRRLLYSPEKNMLAIARKKTGDEEVKVLLSGIKIAAIGKDIQPEQAYGEFIGIAKFSKAIAELFGAKLEEVINLPSGRMHYFEAAVQRLLPGTAIAALDITDLPCIEIDFPQDLHDAQRRIIHKIARIPDIVKKPRILFYVERNLHLPFLEPIHDYIAENYSAELAFSSPPYRISQGLYIGHGLCRDEIRRLSSKSRFYEKASDCKADIAVIADTCFYPVRHCKKIVNVGHGLISKGWFYTDLPVVRRENRADLICVPGPWHKELLSKNVFSPIAVTGFIKSDALHSCGAYSTKKLLEKYHITEGKKVILFAPTFNEELSAIPCLGERIGELTDDDTLLLIKLHGMTDKKWVAAYEKLSAASSRIYLIDDEDFAAAMVCADVMISDVSSAYAEFMLLDKPVVLFNNPRQKHYCQYKPDDIEYRIRDAGIQVASIEELKLAVKLSLANPTEFSEKRKYYAAKLNHAIDGQCSQRAAEAIMEISEGDTNLPRNAEFFSIIVQCNRIFSSPTIEKFIEEQRQKNPGIDFEIIMLGHKPCGYPNAYPEVKAWIECAGINRKALLKAVSSAKGDYIVFMHEDMILPLNWLRCMRYYFTWYQNAGAVKSLSCNDDYEKILLDIPQGQRPVTQPDIADYFLNALMGNEVPAVGIDLQQDCVMLSRHALDSILTGKEFYIDDDTVSSIGTELLHKGFSLWHAVEIFAYAQVQQPADDAPDQASPGMQPAAPCSLPPGNETMLPLSQYADVHRIVEQAQKLTKDKNFSGAIPLLEHAKAMLSEHAGSAQKDITRNFSRHQGGAQPCGMARDTSTVRYLFEEALRFKRKKEYLQAIAKLEEAKLKTA